MCQIKSRVNSLNCDRMKSWSFKAIFPRWLIIIPLCIVGWKTNLGRAGDHPSRVVAACPAATSGEAHARWMDPRHARTSSQRSKNRKVLEDFPVRLFWRLWEGLKTVMENTNRGFSKSFLTDKEDGRKSEVVHREKHRLWAYFYQIFSQWKWGTPFI